MAASTALKGSTESVTVESEDVQMLELGRDTFTAMVESGAVSSAALEEIAKVQKERALINKVHLVAVKDDESPEEA